MLSGLFLIILGLLAVPSLLKNGGAKDLLDKIAVYQGWIGLVFAIWGLVEVIRCIFHIGLLGSAPIWWITWLAAGVLCFCLGFLLGYGLIRKYALSKNEDADEAGAKMLARLRPLQGNLGIAAIVLGIWTIVAYIIR